MWRLHTVLNALKLAAVIGLGLAYLLGLGWLVVGYLLHGNLLRQKQSVSLLQQVSLALVCGLVLNYAIVLAVQSLRYSLVLGGALSLVGLASFTLSMARAQSVQGLAKASLGSWLGLALVSLVYLIPIVFNPLVDWDARSIWFYHAKVIYYAGNFSADWGSLTFHPHLDYPKLVPVMAAQIAHVIGFWNEIMPKTSLVFLFVPAMGFIFTFARRRVSFVFLLALFPFFFDKWLWNGYMDGYLAVYFSVAMLLLGRYVHSSDSVDLVSAVACLFIPLYLKNEGSLVALSAILAIIVLFVTIKRAAVRKVDLKRLWAYAVPLILGLLPFGIWAYYKQSWGLHSSLMVGLQPAYSSFLARISDGSYRLIFHDVYTQLEPVLMLLGLLLVVSLALNKMQVKESLPAFIAAGIYLAGLIVIYFITPHDVGWHLDTSLKRTLLSVSGCLLVGSYFLLTHIESMASNE